MFDYANPVETIADPASRELHERLSQRVAAAGEAFRSYFDTPALHEKLRALGFAEIEDLGPNEIAARYLPGRAAPARAAGGMSRGTRGASEASPTRAGLVLGERSRYRILPVWPSE